jgi:hypothetical protein
MNATEKERLHVLVPRDLRAAVDDYCKRVPTADGRPLSVGEFTRRAWAEKLARVDGPVPPRVVREHDEQIRNRKAQS